MSDDLVPRLRRAVTWQGVVPHNNELAREAAAEIERLQSIINAKLHRRRCHDCGHVGWYADSRTPYCLCDQCRSQDTRRVKEAK